MKLVTFLEFIKIFTLKEKYFNENPILYDFNFQQFKNVWAQRV